MAVKWPLKAILLMVIILYVSFNRKIRVMVLVNGPELTVMNNKYAN